MTGTRQVWLTRDGYARMKDELLRLVKERAGEAPSNDEDFAAERRERDQRIRKLQEMLQDPTIGDLPPDDGVAEPGMVVTVAFADGGDEETFLLAEREDAVHPDVEICSPDSPLGRALVGAREGEVCQYEAPGRRSMTVTLVRAVPYGEY